MAAFRLFGWKKRRKYPVKVDEQGRSARSRCFEMFAEDVPFNEVVKVTGVKIDTVRRYHQQWQKKPDIERQYAYVKELFKKTTPDRDKNVELFSTTLGIEKEQFEAVLSQPHGLRRIITGKFYFPARAEVDHKRSVALELALLISDHLIKHSGKFHDVYLALRRLLHQEMAYREDEDDAIKDESETIDLMRRILAIDLEQERQGRAKPDRLTAAERDAAIRLGLETKAKKLELQYWTRIGEITAEGFTMEQAREKLHQDVVATGDMRMAKTLREFQDKIHPLKTSDQPLPPMPPQTPSPT
jgi:hypothetical protein